MAGGKKGVSKLSKREKAKGVARGKGGDHLQRNKKKVLGSRTQAAGVFQLFRTTRKRKRLTRRSTRKQTALTETADKKTLGYKTCGGGHCRKRANAKIRHYFLSRPRQGAD